MPRSVDVNRDLFYKLFQEHNARISAKNVPEPVQPPEKLEEGPNDDGLQVD